MADGKVTIKADFDGDKAESGIGKLKSTLGQLGESGSKIGSIFKDVLGANLVSGVLMSGLSALKDSISGIASTAAQEGAKLQQSFGGIDTLYTGAEAKMKQFAAEASKAGISANDFAEQAVSFGASLKQALGGDAVAAAEAANRAIMDMADNSAKMGTDIAVVQQTYQSIARGNFAMLDNLKLGFGGTKAEMERLLQTAEKISGKKFDISNFADITEAIHVVQENLGLAGVAAEEAQKTFSGSFAAMQAAFSNVLASLTTGELDINDALSSLASSASAFVFDNLIPMIGKAFSALPGAVSTFVGLAGAKIKEQLIKAMPLDALPLINNFRSMFAAVTDAVKSFGAAFTSAGKGVSWLDLAKSSVSALTSTIEAAATIVKRFMDGFAQTGAINAVKNAFDSIMRAIASVNKGLQNSTGWNSLGTVIGGVVRVVADLVAGFADLISKIDPSIISAFTTGILGAVTGFKLFTVGQAGVAAGFKAFDFLKSFNPFSVFKKNVADSLGDVGKSVGKSKSVIGQVFSGISNVIKSAGDSIKAALGGFVGPIKALGPSIAAAAKGIGTGLATAFKGIGTGLATAAKGVGSALKMLNPAQMLAFGGAIAVAAVGIGAGVAIIAAGFALLASQGQGISQIITAIGSAFSMVASTLIGAFAQAIVTVAGVLPIVAQSLAMLAPLVTAFGQAISMVIVAIGSVAPQFAILAVAIGSAVSSVVGAISGLVTAIAGGISQIITAVTPIVEIISTTFTTVVAIVANAIVQIVQALAPFIPAITDMVVQVAPHLASIAQSFSDMVAQISPIIDSLTELVRGFGEAIRNVLDGAKGVIESFRASVRNILDGIAGIFDSIGNAAKNAGVGVKLMAQGIQILVGLNLGDLVGTLAAVATGLAGIAGSGITTAGPGLQAAGIGMQLMAASAQLASIAIQALPSALAGLVTNIGSLPATLSVAGVAMSSFASSTVASFASLSGSVSSLSILQAQLSAFGQSIAVVRNAISSMAGSFSAVVSSVNALSSILGSVPGRFIAIATGASNTRSSIMQLVSSLPSVVAGFASMASASTSSMTQMNSAIRSAMSQALSVMRSSMQQMVNVVMQSAAQMTQAGQQAGKGVSTGIANGIRSGVGQVQSVMKQLVHSVKEAGMSAVASMKEVGVMIAQGLAQGMRSALGSVTSAANALVAQAERAARAKAQIHSPSRLFRDNVGRYIAQGIAIGIENNGASVMNSLEHIQSEMMAYRFRPEELLDTRGGISGNVRLNASAEKNHNTQFAKEQSKQDTLLKRALEVAEQAVKRPVQMVTDTGALIAEIGGPMLAYQDNSLRLEQAMRGEW
ncbi:TPA: tape measure protein [Streptococcus suis]